MAVKIKRSHNQLPVMASPEARVSLAHKHVMSLGQERVDAIALRMIKGDRLRAIQGTIQGEWKELTKVPEATLYKELSRFRQARVFGKLIHVKDSLYAKDAEELFGQGIDVLANLTKLVAMQQERVTKVFMRERELPTLMNNVRWEIESLARMYMQMAELQMDLGLMKRVPKELLVASVEMAASKAGQMLEEAISRDKRVGERLSRAFKLLEDEFTDLVADDAGVYRPAH